MSLSYAMMLTDGRTLDQVVGPELYQRVVAAGRPYGFGQDHMRLFKPWAIMTLLSLPPSEVKRQAAGEMALDHRLQEAAAERGIASSRIAHGVPLGGELEYVDGGTLAHAFAGRRRLTTD